MKLRSKLTALIVALVLVIGGLYPTTSSFGQNTFVELGQDDLLISGGALNGLTDTGLEKFNTAIQSGSIHITFASGVSFDTVGENLFQGLFGDTTSSVVLPAGVQTIGKSAFENNAGLKTVVLPEGLKRINDYAFRNTGLEGDAGLPSTLIHIGYEAFAYSSLTSVTIPDGIETLYAGAFRNNQIETANLGTMERMAGQRWDSELNPNRGILAYNLFQNNKIKTLTIPKAIWAIGANAFENNSLTELFVPLNIGNIYRYAFNGNTNLEKVEFQYEDASGNRNNNLQIDRSAFQNCNITGELVLHANVNQIGGYSFANNNITHVKLPQTGIGIGYYAFRENPLERVTNVDARAWLFELGAFSYSDTLKNISFDTFVVFDRFYEARTQHLPNGTFFRGLLRTVEIPANLPVIDGSKVFDKNLGWAEGDNKVALYRKTKGSDNLLSSGEYVTNNFLPDATSYVINPVKVVFDFTDQYGGQVESSALASGITLTRTRGTSATVLGTDLNYQDTELTVSTTDTQNFKIGDKLTFKFANYPNYDFVSSNLSLVSGTTDVYEITLSPENLMTEYYSGYDVGYKQIIIKASYNGTNIQPPTTTTQPTTAQPSTEGIPATENQTSSAEAMVIPSPSSSSTSDVQTSQTQTTPITTEPTQTIVAVPSENPDTEVVYVPVAVSGSENLSTNPDENIFTILNEDGVPLGVAKINNDGTYFFVDEESVPLGVAKINKDNTLDILAEEVPLSTLPQTGLDSNLPMYIFGMILLVSGLYLRRK